MIALARRSQTALAAGVMVLACSAGAQDDDPWHEEPTPVAPPKTIEDLDAVGTRAYLSQLAPFLVSRELTQVELDRIDDAAYDAIVPILSAWTKESAFGEAARRLVSQKLSLNGRRDGINFDLPGNLAAYVAVRNLPFTTLLTADFCVGDDGEETTCDTDAPYNAGVLGTRAFLAGRAGRYNLTRASTMMNAFACRKYPMAPDFQPPLARETLIQMFQVNSAEEILDPKAKSEGEGFGNGSACYNCHGQFGAHAQLFVRFDEEGVYLASATGLQDPDGELGRSTNGLYASHLLRPTEAASEATQMLGKPVENLRDAAKILAESSSFVPCQVENLFEYVLGNDISDPLTSSVRDELVTALLEKGDPTFADYVLVAFGHPRIVAALTQGIGAFTP